jgi:cell wall assembly regulator SMI1
MQESQRLIKSWSNIEHWLSENFPETLDNLYSPAFDSQIDAAETTLGLAFPDALKALLLEHNGENNHWPPGIFPNGHRFLPVEDIVEIWYTFQDFGGYQSDDESSCPQEKWLPISMSETKSVRILDFNPPQGGRIGQVVEVTPNKMIYRVLAPSLMDYLEQYAIDLAVNKYTVKGDYIVQKTSNPRTAPASPQATPSRSQPSKARVHPIKTPGSPVKEPPTLEPTKARVKPIKPVAKPMQEPPAREPMQSGERVIIVGEMTSLMGKDAVLFSVEAENGKEYTFLAKSTFTKGFGSIAIDQTARILAKPFKGEIKSHFIEQGLANRPDFVALEYTMLFAAKNLTTIPATPLAENIDELAHNILDSIRLNVNRSLEFNEVKAEQCPSMRAKFYNDVTERLLKLGFHYTADLQDRTISKSALNSPAFFRVMSFFDDGIVASFYHIKPKLSWPFHAARKVVEFETELSDGHIIISTTAEDDSEFPLPGNISRFVHTATIPVEGLLYKHRSKIRRYQTHHPESSIIKIRSKKEYIALRQRRQQMIHDHLHSIGWVTREYVVKQFNNREIAEQVYDRIKVFVGNQGLKAAGK